MIKNSFLQRISEKPLNVPPAIDFNLMKYNTYLERKKRREKKPNLKAILNILHCHPCYFLEMYKKPRDMPEKLFTTDEMLSYLKNIYPSRCFTNAVKPMGEEQNSGMNPMINREQERPNLLLISFIKNIIKEELSQYASIDKVDFLSKDSIIGRLFYRIFKS